MKDSSAGSGERAEEAGAPYVESIRAKRSWWPPHFRGRVPLGLDSRYVSLVGVVALAIYFGPGAGIPFFWIPFVFILTGSSVLMRVISSELFPASIRNTALGWETPRETLGGAIEFALVGSFTAASASIAAAVVVVSALTVLGVIVVWILPETADLKLDATSKVSSTDAQG